MAWVLAGGFVAAYGISLISDAYESATKPIYDYFDARRKANENYTAEQIRQSNIARRKKLLENNNEIRNTYNITKKNITKLTNDTNSECLVMFVNHEQALNVNDAIKCTEPALTCSLSPNDSMNLIRMEFEEYFILLSIRGDIIVLSVNEIGKEEINIKNLTNTKHIDNDVTIDCKWF